MRKTAKWKSILGHVKTFVVFAGMLLAIALEGECVYWLLATRITPTHTGINNLHLAGQWTGATLPQCRLFGALLVLFYRASTILIRPQRWGRAGAQSNRRSLVRLWRWTVALGSLQLGALYLDRFTIGAH
jgi:hypothetical protein